VPTITVPRPDFNEIDQIAMDLVDGEYQHASTRSRPPMNWFFHTQEGGGGDSAATDLAAFLRSTSGSSAVSYHYTASVASDGGTTVVDVVDTDYYSWSVLDANVFSINGCIAGSSASWSRDQWMKQKSAIEAFCYLAVQDAFKYGFSTEVIPPPYGSPRAGISDHKYVTQCLHIGTHTDCGPNFPWDFVIDRVNYYTSNAPVVTQPVPVTPPPAPADPFLAFLKKATDRELLEYIAAQQGPGDPAWQSKGMTQRDKLWAVAAKVGA
jgi:hypothetical protein